MDPAKAYYKAAAICARSEQCISAIRTRLLKWELEEAEAAKIIKRLVDEKFIDESRYAGFFVRDKARFNKWGPKKIAWQLRQKGLPEDVIREAIDSVPWDNVAEDLEELLRKKLAGIKQDDPYKKKAALVRFAASRGFGFSEIEKVLGKLKF